MGLNYEPKSWALTLALQESQNKLKEEQAKAQESTIASQIETGQPAIPYTPSQTKTTWQPKTIARTQQVSTWQPRSQVATMTTPETAVVQVKKTNPVATTKTTKTEWWEQPAAWGESVMNKVGETISKTPILPDFLKWLEPAFNWVSENLEKPFAAIITAPFSTSLPWRKGENWIDHEKREYEAWNSPTYVKGLAEFAMPLWWLPYVGWLSKGAKTLATGGKLAQAASKALSATARVANLGLPVKSGSKAAKAVSVLDDVPKLPTDEILNSSFTPNTYRKFAWATENVPVVKNVVKFFGGSSAFVRGDATTPLQIAKREIVKAKQIEGMSSGVYGLLMPKLQVLGNFNKILDVTETKITKMAAGSSLDVSSGIVKTATPKTEGLSRYFGDVIENPSNYKFSSKEAEVAANTAHDILTTLKKMAADEGVEIDAKIHRRVMGQIEDGKLIKPEAESSMKFRRTYDTQLEGVKNGVIYDNNIYTSLGDVVNSTMKRIALKRLTNNTKGLGKTIEELWDLSSGKGQLYADLKNTLSQTKVAGTLMQRALRGESLHGVNREMLRVNLPKDVMQKIEDGFAFAPVATDKVINSLAKDLKQYAKLTPTEFKMALAEFKKSEGTLLREQGLRSSRITVHDINEVLGQKVKEKAVLNKLTEKVYQDYYLGMKNSQKELFKSALDDIKNITETTKSEFKGLSSERSKFISSFQGKYNLGAGGMAKFSGIPEFGDRLFPVPVVKAVESSLRDSGIEFLKKTSTLSGMSRMLTATLDLSAPLIQGLPLAGYNPVAWAKAIGRMMTFTWKPSNVAKYSELAETKLIRAERFAAGSMPSGFEYTEAFKPLQEVLGKIPKAGGVAQKVLGATYGRAEAAFQFGEVARDYAWKAMTAKYRNPDGTLKAAIETQMDIARTIDRMTGSLSTTALGISQTQQQIEASFLFFSPRYTRAGFALMGDILRGGISGKQSRVILGSMVASGLVTYYETCKLLGQQPNFDPSSGRFMTVQIGQQHVGVGGIYVGMLRFAYDLGVTAVEKPIDLISNDRFDNPFIRFIYSRSAPLTGTLYGLAVEHKDYLGEPLESPLDYAQFMLDKITPIALQSLPQVIEDEGAGTPLVFAFQEAGARMFPTSSWERRNEARGQLAQSQFGTNYDNLSELQKYQINQNEDVKKYQTDADKQTVTKGDALSIAFINRQGELDDARSWYVDTLNNLQSAYDFGLITGYEFREELQTTKAGLGAIYEHINQNEAYKEVLAEMQKSDTNNINKKALGDVAYAEYANAVGENSFEDQYGIFDYEKYNNFMEYLQNKYGSAAYQYVLDYQSRRDSELPPMALEYKKAQSVLKPYWGVYDWVVKNYGKDYADGKRGQSLVSRLRKQMKRMDLQVLKYYDMFYNQNT